VDLHDPHPPPWIRVLLGCAIGERLYPHPQWAQLARLWRACYPLEGVDPARRATFEALLATSQRCARILCAHRAPALDGASLGEVLVSPERHPSRLIATWRRWRRAPEEIFHAPPSLVFAVLGRARLSGELDPDSESRLLEDLLTHWALRSTLDISALCASSAAQSRRFASPTRPALQLATA
jgi:hypothetical protein